MTEAVHNPADAKASRKLPSLRRRLTWTLLAVTLLSVLLLGVFNYILARQLIGDAVEAQLASQGRTRAEQIQLGADQLAESVSVLASSRAVVRSMKDLASAFDQLAAGQMLLEPEQEAELERAYEEQVVAPVVEAGLTSPPLSELVPDTEAGRLLQYRYLVENPNPPDERFRLVDQPSDDSAYRPAHAEHHPTLAGLTSTLGFGDMLLIDRSGRVVYSVQKRLDFGSRVGIGVGQSGPLGPDVLKKLDVVPVGETIFTDFAFYLPARARPTMFAIASVRDDTEVIGSIALEVPIDSVNSLMSGGAAWEETGLGDTGEVYLVGPDGLLRSESRRWIEDRVAYLDRISELDLDAQLAERMAVLDTSVLLQPVDTEPVATAQGGKTFNGRARDYLDERSIAFATPVDVEDLDWVVVAQFAASEAGGPLGSFLTRVLLVAAILIPVVVGLAFWLANAMTRPLNPVIDASTAIAAGDLTAFVPDLGRNEIGDVGRRINTLTADLRDYSNRLEREEEEITELLLAALPPRLVEQVRAGERHIDDLVDSATLIAITIGNFLEEHAIDSEAGMRLSAELSKRLETQADRRDIERVRSSSTEHLFVAGVGRDGVQADAAAEFAVDAQRIVRDLSEESGVPIGYRSGLASGVVIAGLLSVDQLGYGVFGEPPRLALILASSADDGEILIHRSALSELSDSWSTTEPEEIADTGDESIEAAILDVASNRHDAPGGKRDAH